MPDTFYSRHLEIENPNTSGQGYNKHHSENPHHGTLTQWDWNYSHTTAITKPDGSKYAMHTYKSAINPDWCCGVVCQSTFPVRLSKLGNSTARVFVGLHTEHIRTKLTAYLKRKNSELRRAAKNS